jgi:hypothetical protein
MATGKVIIKTKKVPSELIDALKTLSMEADEHILELKVEEIRTITTSIITLLESFYELAKLHKLENIDDINTFIASLKADFIFWKDYMYIKNNSIHYIHLLDTTVLFKENANEDVGISIIPEINIFSFSKFNLKDIFILDVVIQREFFSIIKQLNTEFEKIKQEVHQI